MSDFFIQLLGLCLATANGLFGRIRAWAEQQCDGESRTIRLAHGMTDLNEEYRSLFRGTATDSEEIVHEWFEGRKQALLADFVTATVDNLVEDSSGQNKSGTAISKRGRKTLRNVLYTMSLSCVAANKEIKELYNYLKTRAVNPLKKKQALVVIAKKIITIIYTIITKRTTYQAEKVLGAVRKEMMAA